MANKRKIVFGFSSLLLMLYIIYVCNGKSINVYSVIGIPAYMNVPILSQEELEEKISGKNQVTLENGLFYNYAKVPFDVEKQTVYIYQNTEEELWEGSFSLDESLRAEGYNGYFLEDDLWKEKSKAIQDGHAFKMYIVGKQYYEIDVVFSGIGVMSISWIEDHPKELSSGYDTYDLESEPEFIGETTVLGMDMSGRYQTIQGYVKYHKKGGSSSTNPKISYAISFVDEGGKEVSMSVMGMDSYHKWKLNALYTDNTLVREKSAIDIWCLIDRKNTDVDNGSFEAEYVELVFDGAHVGTYLLVEPIDGTKLELDYNDVLYKCVAWELVSPEDIDEAVAAKRMVISPFEIKHPKAVKDYSKAWAPMRDFINVFYCGADLSGTSLQQRVNVKNLIDLDIFIRICALSDNTYKNLYFSAHVNPDDTYEMTMHPWDFDLSFGHVYKSGAEGSYCFDDNVSLDYNSSALQMLIKENSDIGMELYATYVQYRAGILNDENILSIINDNWETLQKSGAYARNLKLWKVEHGDVDASTVIEFILDRLKYIDNYYGGKFVYNGY